MSACVCPTITREGSPQEGSVPIYVARLEVSMLTRRTALLLMLSTPLLGWSDRAVARPPNAITKKVALLITDKDLRDEIRRSGLGYLHVRGPFSRGYLVVGRKGNDSGAMVGFTRKHRTSVVCERLDALRRFVEANALKFYTTTAYFRRVETVMPLDRVEALIRRDA
jgi:hypothetical protein